MGKKKTKPERFTVAQVAAALEATRGNVSEAARQMGCTRGLVRRYVERHPQLKDVLETARHEMLDFAESKLQQHIESGSERLLMFFLQTQGRRRGYGRDLIGIETGAAVERVIVTVHTPTE